MRWPWWAWVRTSADSWSGVRCECQDCEPNERWRVSGREATAESLLPGGDPIVSITRLLLPHTTFLSTSSGHDVRRI